MGRQPARASQVKARQAIKNTAPKGAAKKSENMMVPRHKRGHSPGGVAIAPKAKRSALGDMTNQVLKQQVVVKGKTADTTAVKPVHRVEKVGPHQMAPRKEEVKSFGEKTELHTKAQISVSDQKPSPQQRERSTSSSTSSGHAQCEVAEVTPVTAVQNSLQATRLNDSVVSGNTPPQGAGAWHDIDKAESHDPLFSSQYAPEIYQYMRTREECLCVCSYMTDQADITASMRAILVDWLIEVQENFELFHETLYLAVQLTDRYLCRAQVKREYLQLVGATCMLIAAKFEELSPPLVDDFLYLCDDAYTHDDLLNMERDILHELDYDINIPIAYRFLRRLARAADATMETHTFARYISESTLQDYSFVTERPSYIAAGAMYLALRIRKLGPWTPTLEHYSGYQVDDLLPLVHRLNSLLLSPLGHTSTVRSKYSHEVFFKVATLPPLEDVDADALETQSC